MGAVIPYLRRVVDDELDELFGALAAIAIEGPKGVGKTRTALQRARTVRRLDDPAELTVAKADPARLLEGERPVLLDEWQRLPQVWDLVRRAVDDGAPPGSILLTGSALPDPPPTHSGAGRIVAVRMRPLALSERLQSASVSLAELLSGARAPVTGATDVALTDYTEEILGSGLPGLRRLSGRARRLQLEGYVNRIVDRDIPDDAGVVIRNPAALRRWMAAYAAASSTTATFETVRDAARAGHEHKPSKNATQAYRDALMRVWVLDAVPAWIPSNNRLSELGQAPKHQLADPALASCSAFGPRRYWPAGAQARRWLVTARCSARCSRASRRCRCASTPLIARRRSGIFEPRAGATRLTSSSSAPTAASWPSKSSWPGPSPATTQAPDVAEAGTR